MRKIVWLVVAIIVIAGGYLFLKGNTTTPESDNSLSEGTEIDNMMPAPGSDASEMVVGDSDAMMKKEPAATIRYTDAGYEPKDSSVRVGETVRFVNDSASQETWPASAVHPTHSVYPEKSEADCLGSAFDACRGLKSGESWDFTFDVAGEWKFHDHLHASKFGSVTVTE